MFDIAHVAMQKNRRVMHRCAKGSPLDVEHLRYAWRKEDFYY